MVVDVDPKTVILVRNCVLCSSLQFSLLGTMIQSVFVSAIERGGVVLYVTLCDSRKKREVKPW